MTGIRSAVVQDWFFSPGGSEQVAMELAGMLPRSEVVTTFMEQGYVAGLAGHPIRTWPLQRVLGASKRYRNFLPLYPLWFGGLDLRNRELVVSSSSAFAKAVRTRIRAHGGLHIAYIHTPMRYAWDLDTYLAGSTVSLPSRLSARMIRPLLKVWDRATAQRPDILVANSGAVRERIWKFWGREAEVIHPPVRIGDFHVSTLDEGYLMVAARLVAYRRVDLLVSAAAVLDRELIVVGDGPEMDRLRRIAGRRTRFMGHVPRNTLVHLLARCHAYVVPGEEDFGIAPVEAMAAGKPVIAFRAGGALDSVVEGTSGIFFDEQSPDALMSAIETSDRTHFNPDRIRMNAERFAPGVFRARFVDLFRRYGVDPSLYRAADD